MNEGFAFESSPGEGEKMINAEVERLMQEEEDLISKLSKSVQELQDIKEMFKHDNFSLEAEEFRQKIRSEETSRNLENKLKQLVETHEAIVEKIEQIDVRVKRLKDVLNVNPRRN